VRSVTTRAWWTKHRSTTKAIALSRYDHIVVRLFALLVLVLGCGGKDKSQGGDGGTGDGNTSTNDGNTAMTDGNPIGDGGSLDAPSCTGQTMMLGDGSTTSCSFDVNASFDPASVNVVIRGNSTREVVCHTVKETGCSGSGWYWNYSHQITLCDASCTQLISGGGAMQLVLETGCATASCTQGSCTANTGVCTHQTAYTCCSGRCDGDSCGSGLWGVCSGMFGCFEGTCQSGYCRCPTSTIQCGASCFNPMTSQTNCGTCGNACSGGKTCQSGTCTCPSGLTDCNGTCVNLTSDMANCGMCGRACRVEQTCSSSNCYCPTGQNDCAGACVAVTDPMHCGACNNACDMATETCQPLINGSAYCACNAGLFDCNGTCVDRLTDENNCGTCGHVCPGNKQCINGSC
jgi:hypothetical protein